MQKVLITGSNGMLGSEIVRALEDEFLLYGINRKVIIVNSKVEQYSIDLTNTELIKRELKNLSPDIVILCAANVNVDACETDRQNAFKLHVESTNVLSTLFNKSKFVYISTDSVFDGEKGLYKENDITNPLNYYARTKLEGENVLLKNSPDSLIIRTNIIGCNNPLRNSITEWAIKNLSENKQINGFADVYFNPIYTRHLALIIPSLIKSNINGILNIAGGKATSKYDFLSNVAEIFGFSSNLVKRTSVKDFNFNALRPLNTTLNTDKYISTFNKPLPNFIDGLKDIKSLYCKT